MKIAVFSFVSVSADSVVASVRIAKFIAKTLDAPLIWDASIKTTRWDVLILVNGAFSFCQHRDDVAVAIRRAKRIIWIQNDYAIYAPINDGAAESTFRKAFRIRKDKGLPDMDHWTTVEVKATMTEFSRYINWNMLTALPKALRCAREGEDLFYYGAYRNGRRKTFDAYFKPKKIPLTISSPSKKFSQFYPHATILAGIERAKFYRELNSHGLGLYIEDPRSHKEFHSPANRFYEMLSAGLPMVFEPDSQTMLQKAGYDITPYIIESQKDARQLLKRRRRIGKEQNEMWWNDFRDQLKDKLERAFRRYVRHTFPT